MPFTLPPDSVLYQHPAFRNVSAANTTFAGTFASTPLMPAYGPSPSGRKTSFNTPAAVSGASAGNSGAAAVAVSPGSLTMQHLNKLIKGVKDVNDMDKLYFTGEGLQIGARFLQWFTMLADEAVMYDTNLGPYFSMSLGTAEEEHKLMDQGAAYDHFVFHLSLIHI